MSSSVQIEPCASGFRATIGIPVEFSAEAATADEAVANVREQFLARLRATGQLRVLTKEDVQVITRAAARLSKNPLLPEMQKAREEFRREQDALAETGVELRVLTIEQAQEIQNTVEYLKAHPLSAEYEQAMEEYRLQHNAKPYPEA